MQKPNKPILIQRLVINHEENQTSSKSVILTGIYSNSIIKSIIIKDKTYEVKHITSVIKPSKIEKKIVKNDALSDDVIVITTSDDVTVIDPSVDIIVKSNGVGKIEKKKPKKKKEKVVILNEPLNKPSKTPVENKELTIEKQSVEPKKRNKSIKKLSTNSKRQKTIKPIVPSKNSLIKRPIPQKTKKYPIILVKQNNTQTDPLPIKIVENNIKPNVVPVFSWQSVYQSISFNAKLPSGRVISRDVWYTHVRSLGSHPREISINDCFLIKSDMPTVRDVFVHIVGFWLDENARWMVTVLKYKKFSPDWMVGTVEDGDIALDMLVEKCVVLTLREYSRHKTALMRRNVDIGQSKSFEANSLLNGLREANDRHFDCDHCMPKSFVASGFFH